MRGAALLLALAAALPLPAAAAPGPEQVDVAVLAHAVERGDRIDAGDFTSEPRAPAAARGALAVADAAGMEAVRNLQAGSVVRRGDIIRPQLVRRGEPVSIRLAQGGLTITTSGRALSNGAEGDMVRVVVNSTSRTLDATVDGTGSVTITAP